MWTNFSLFRLFSNEWVSLKWCSFPNSLTANFSKCQSNNLFLKPKQNINKLLESDKSCTIPDRVQKPSKVFYLGAMIPSYLSWSSHVLLLSMKIFRVTYYINELRVFHISGHLVLRFVGFRILLIILSSCSLFFHFEKRFLFIAQTAEGSFQGV